MVSWFKLPPMAGDYIIWLSTIFSAVLRHPLIFNFHPCPSDFWAPLWDHGVLPEPRPGNFHHEMGGLWKKTILVGGFKHFLFSPIVGMMIQSDIHIFQRGRYTTNFTNQLFHFRENSVGNDALSSRGPQRGPFRKFALEIQLLWCKSWFCGCTC